MSPMVTWKNVKFRQLKPKEVREILNQQASAKHFDKDKPDVSQVPRELIEEVARVMQYGEGKYGKHNWRGGMKWSRLVGSICRHMLAFNSGEDLDPESKLPHLAHAAANIGFLLNYANEHKELDDRFKPEK